MYPSNGSMSNGEQAASRGWGCIIVNPNKKYGPGPKCGDYLEDHRQSTDSQFFRGPMTAVKGSENPCNHLDWVCYSGLCRKKPWLTKRNRYGTATLMHIAWWKVF